MDTVLLQPVRDFIKKSCKSDTQEIIIHCLELLETYGHHLGMPHVKKLNSKLCELRIRGRQEIRLLYCFKAQQIIILHGFVKKTNKTPVKELDTAKKRANNLT